MIPHSWIKECLELFGVADNITRAFEQQHEELKIGANVFNSFCR